MKFCCLLGLGVLMALAACGRDQPVAPKATPPPGLADLSTAPAQVEAPDISDLEAVPALPWPVAYKDPDGQIWSKYTCGLLIQKLKPNPGKIPAVGQTVTVAYTGMFPDSKKVFDASPKDQPLKFRYGTTHIIKGWNYAISTMKAGERILVYIPADLAYGKAGRPPVIGPDQPLLFDMELLDVMGEAADMPSTNPATGPATFPEMKALGPAAPASATAPH